MTDNERLAVLETEVRIVKESQGRIEAKLDEAIACKADRSDVDEIRLAVEAKADKDDFDKLQSTIVGIVLATCGLAVTTLVGLAVYLLQSHIK